MLGSRGQHTVLFWRYKCKELLICLDRMSPKHSKLTEEEKNKRFDIINHMELKEAISYKYELEKKVHDIMHLFNYKK